MIKCRIRIIEAVVAYSNACTAASLETGQGIYEVAWGAYQWGTRVTGPLLNEMGMHVLSLERLSDSDIGLIRKLVDC